MPEPIRAQPSRRAVAWLVNQALTAQRHGHMPELPTRARRLRLLAEEPWLRLVWSTLGDRLPADQRWAQGVPLLMTWALGQLRPDKQALLSNISLEAWTQSTAWRPMLSLAAQHGLLAIPDLPASYRRRPGEAVADNLCGLWAVGPSTLYRYMDKGRRLLVDLMANPAPHGDTLISLRQFVDQFQPLGEPGSSNDWHLARAREALVQGSATDALWHQWRGGAAADCATTIRRFAVDLAGGQEVDAVLHDLLNQKMPPELRFDLALSEASLWKCRRSEKGEQDALRLALRIGHDQASPWLLGRAHAALALFDHSRDLERAISGFEASIEHLQEAVTAASASDQQKVMGEYANSMIHLAWLHLRRNDPKARTLLSAASRMRSDKALPDETIAFLELALGEQCRCEGRLDAAIEHRHRSLLIYERLGDLRSIINCHNNLCLLYAQQGDYAKAHEYGQRVLQASKRSSVEPELVANAHGNMAVACMSADEPELAIMHLHEALRIYRQFEMRRHMVAAHFNLAETHYKRFKARGNPEDERLGDENAQIAQAMGRELGLEGFVQNTAGLKREILGAAQEPDKLAAPEHAAHPHESAELDRLRNDLALPRPAAQRARTHLAIARQYLLIAAKEREAARALIAKHHVPDDFSAEFDALRQAWERELTREQALAAVWREKLGDLMSDAQRRAVVAHVLAEGTISKSGYASVAQVSPATASKHLGLLAERGLLLQIGNGPSTRYVVPTAAETPES